MFSKKEFSLTDDEYEFVNRWEETHKCSCRGKSCCGGEMSITFTPTSIGTHISVKCVCGQEIEVREVG